MNIKILQTREDPSWNFDVIVEENGTSTQHSVSMSKDYYNDLNTDKQPWEVIYECFVFLLDNESKDQIRPEFDVTLITYFFPNFKDYLMERLNKYVSTGI